MAKEHGLGYTPTAISDGRLDDAVTTPVRPPAEPFAAEPFGGDHHLSIVDDVLTPAAWAVLAFLAAYGSVLGGG